MLLMSKEDYISSLHTSLVLFISNGKAKRQLATYWHCDIVKTSATYYPGESSVNSVFFEKIKTFWLGFIMVTYEKIYLEAYINT